MISKDEEKAFYEIMGSLVEDAEKIEKKVDSQNRLKIVLWVFALVLGLVGLISAVMFENIFLGITGFAVLFTGGYMLSKVINI
jgi:hypothetical protein